MKFYFLFGGVEYCVVLHIVPGSTPPIFCHRDIDSMGLNYQSLYKFLERPEDGYKEEVGIRQNLLYLVFPSFG